MDLTEALLESWDRQCNIVNAVATLINESNRHVKPSEDGWELDKQLAHTHRVRAFWLSRVDPERAEKLGSAFQPDTPNPITDLDAIRGLLKDSELAIREAVAEGLQKPLEPIGGYDNIVLFLQHMIWHEGWHVGLIFLGLRLNGEEPEEEWEEPNVWGQWRTE
jgi:uncharacterized damage-inducible protein DinB